MTKRKESVSSLGVGCEYKCYNIPFLFLKEFLAEYYFFVSFFSSKSVAKKYVFLKNPLMCFVYEWEVTKDMYANKKKASERHNTYKILCLLSMCKFWSTNQKAIASWLTHLAQSKSGINEKVKLVWPFKKIIHVHTFLMP